MDDKADVPDYDPTFASFDSPLMQVVRRQAYGEDIGQHSWVTANQLRTDLARLSLTASSRLLDVGCGPCGPLVFLVRESGCRGTGVDVSVEALSSGAARARAAGVEKRVELQRANLDLPLPFEDRAFDAIISLDVILHIRDRKALFGEIARVLAPGGRFLFTDAGVISGVISTEEISLRSADRFAQFVPPGFNETLLGSTGFRITSEEDRTASVILNAAGRLSARRAHRPALEDVEGKDAFATQQRYLETVIALSERRALTRRMYCAERARD